MNFIHVMFKPRAPPLPIFCSNYRIGPDSRDFLRGPRRSSLSSAIRMPSVPPRRHRSSGDRLICPGHCPVQIDPECRALPQCAVHIDKAFVLLDDSVTRLPDRDLFPRPISFVVKKGSKIWASVSASIPVP